MAKKHVSIVVPTYNERNNLPALFGRIGAAMAEDDYEIVLVDDDSPDKTWEMAADFSRQYPVKVIRRMRDKGLATAVISGIQSSEADIVVVIDADLQHPPEKIPALVGAIDQGADIAIGSRFVKGGRIVDWGLFRYAVSRGATYIARTFFKSIQHVNDIQSGFFALRKEIVNVDRLRPLGYKILLEIMIMCDYRKIVEVPIVFRPRQAGESKLGLANVVDYLRHVMNLAWRTGEFHRFIKFCLIGGLGAVINLTATWFLTETGTFYYLVSGAIGIELGILSNFILNKLWTFQDVKISGIKAVGKAFLKDQLVRSVGLAANLFILWIMTEYFTVYYLYSQMTGVFLVAVWNFSGNKWFTWE